MSALRPGRQRQAPGSPARVAVVGAGLSGLVAATVLQEQGLDVVVVEKARGPGGRMSTRRHGDLRFDHGAQYFTARDPRFVRQVRAWRDNGRVEEWQARIGVFDNGAARPASTREPRYVALPGMNGICSELAGELDEVRFNWQLTATRRHEHGWRLHNSDGDTLQADTLLVTAPPPQTARLLDDPIITDALAAIDMQPCWALMIATDQPVLSDFDAAFVNQGPLSWIASQSSKPARPGTQAWVVHASPEWSRQNLEARADRIETHLLAALSELPGATAFRPLDVVAHRWRFALAGKPLDAGALWFPDLDLAVAGDWCHGSRVEGAYLSGLAAADQILQSRPCITDPE